MKNILAIFKEDFLRIKKNVIAIVVIMGITLLPCLYAWFNIAASWNPYGNTGNLKVAVASLDEGYDGSIIPINVNIGEQVLSKLRENTQLEWVFTGEEKAVEGVKSGEYYAAIVIPKDFSNKMMSIFSSDIEKPEIIYYSNDKDNAIAPKVTDEGATAIQTQINDIFTETIADAVITDLQTVSKLSDESGNGEVTVNLSKNLEQVSEDLYAAADTMSAFSLMTSFAQQMLDTTAEFLEQSEKNLEGKSSTMESEYSKASGLSDVVNGATDKINNAMSSGKQFYEELGKSVEPEFLAQADSAKTAADNLSSAAKSMDGVIDSYEQLSKALTDIEKSNPELSNQTSKIQKEVNDAINAQNDLQNLLNDTSSFLQNSSSDAQNAEKNLKNLVSKDSQGTDDLQSDYDNNVKKDLEKLFDSIDAAEEDLSVLMTELEKSMSDLYSLAETGSEDLSKLQASLDDACARLQETAAKIQNTAAELEQMKDSKDFSLIDFILSSNPENISTFLASPVKLKTTEIYPIANYGSAMAPFYSTLSIWIGGIVLAAMIKVHLPESYTEKLTNLRPHQVYFGRYIMFLILGLLQSTLICLGDLLYLGIQCVHPMLFLIAGWFSSIVYVNIVYTLTVSFGDVGKAAAVILLVMQVAGSGGTFPIEVAPKFFQIVYPLLPFTHSMAAMRECIGGMYGMTYFIELGKLGIFLVISLVLGLVLRKPIIKLNKSFSEKLEDTKLM